MPVVYAGFTVQLVAPRGEDLYEHLDVGGPGELASVIARAVREHVFTDPEYDGDVSVEFDEQAGEVVPSADRLVCPRCGADDPEGVPERQVTE